MIGMPLKQVAHMIPAGIPTELDNEQIIGSCRDWISTDTYVSMHNKDKGITLYCPDAPLFQIGDFNFGRENKSIPRKKNPLLLAWPMNNYWETNFRASQPGYIELNYGILIHGKYDPVEICRQGYPYTKPIQIHLATDYPAPGSGEMINLSGKGVELQYLKKAEDGNGIILQLVNLKNDNTDLSFSFPGLEIDIAWHTSPAEKNINKLIIKDNAININLKSRQPETIRVKFSNK